MSRRLLPSLLITLFALPLAAAEPRLWGTLEPGPHAVGFRLFDGDSAPGSSGWQPRKIEIALWYPAIKSAAAPVTFGDYFRISDDLRRRSTAAGGDRDDLEAVLSTAISGDPAAVPRDVTRTMLDSPMRARRDAEPAKGRFPIVVWSTRYGTTAAQSLLSEYLASHGYVVVFARAKEKEERLPFELKTQAEKYEELDALVDDMRGALRAARELPYADARAAVIAWSYTGETAIRLQQSDARIEAVIALSTNALEEWVFQPAEALAALKDAPLRVPYFQFTQKKERPALWPHMPARSRFLSFDKISHGNFNFVEGMLPALFDITRVHRWSRAGADAQPGYERLAREVRRALDETLGAKPSRAAFETVELKAADGLAVTADLYRVAKPRGCIALLHQSGSSRGEFRSIAIELARLGFTSIAPDLRWGRRDRWNDVWNETARRSGTIDALDRGERAKFDSIMAAAVQDAEAAVLRLRAECKAPLIVWGSSIHANRALELGLDERVQAAISVSPGEYTPSQPERMRGIAAKLERPLLVMWGRREDETSKPVFEAAASHAKESYASPAGRHGNVILFEDPVAWQRVKAFLDRVVSTR